MSARVLLTIHEPGGKVWVHRTAPGECTVGNNRHACQLVIESADISPQHVKLTLGETEFTIQDLGSSKGTAVDGVMLDFKQTYAYPQMVQMGNVRLEVELDDPARITARAAPGDTPALTAQRLGLLYELPLQFARETELSKLCHVILNSVLRVITTATRGALLIYEPSSGKLALRAAVPENDPPISRTLIRRAALEQEGFIWEMDNDTAVSASIARLSIRTGIYAPLVWNGQVYGVISVDHPDQRQAFSAEDLSFLIAVANYAAAAMAGRLLQDLVEQHNRTLQHLLANFSPKLRNKLLEKSRQGRLQPGGEKSEVTILMSDFRGFTKASEEMDPEFVVHMLNDYFTVLGEVVFQHDGTIDKFIGDAILAVFGSPEPDAQHARKAAQCALAMRDAMKQINYQRRRKGMITCEMGIGVHTGEVLHGFIGTPERLEFTVIGDTVNKAARYCDAAGYSEVLLSATTLAALGPAVCGEQRMIETKHEGTLKAWTLQSVDPS